MAADRCLSGLCQIVSRRTDKAAGEPAFKAFRMTNMKLRKTHLCAENGASAAEYALLLAIIGAGVAVAGFALGGNISNSINKASNRISSTTGVCWFSSHTLTYPP